MRRILALGCCALYLTFGLMAGAAHVHESADHHQETRGLHVDHTHLGDAADHRHQRHHEHGSPADRDAHFDDRHVGHHDGDAHYLTASALRSSDSSPRIPATVSVGATIDPFLPRLDCIETLSDRPRDPPRERPTLPRAPPA